MTKVRREEQIYEARQWNQQWRGASKSMRNAVCLLAHYGGNRPHVHTVIGVHYLAENDWLLQRADGHFLCFTAAEFARECEPLQVAACERRSAPCAL